MNYWLAKTEPDVFSIDDLKASENKTAPWEGVRNYQARNFMRDGMKKGDLVFIYHSSCDQVGIAGLATVIRESYPDPTQFIKSSEYFDPKSSKEAPRWQMVDVKFKKKYPRVLSLKEIKEHPILSQMVVAKRSRLSITPVSENEFKIIEKLLN